MLNWEQKLSALQALTDTALRMRGPGDWYISAERRSVGGDGFLTGTYGNGKTPQEAVEDDFRKLAEMLPSDKYIVVRKSGGDKQFRWNGFMWQEVIS